MSRRPRRVSGIDITPAVAKNTLQWDSVGFDPLIDHYKVHGVPGRSKAFRASADNLLARSVFPRWVHNNLDPAGEDWTYQVVALSDAGLEGPASRAFAATSTPSVTVTGRELVRAGAYDGKTLEFQFSPRSYSSIPKAYPEAIFDFTDGADTLTSWPFLLPGPGDSFAGNKVYVHRWHFDLEELAADPSMALWLVDTTRVVSTMEIKINGSAIDDLILPTGGTKGSTAGDAATEPELVRSYHEFTVDHGLFRTGKNTIEFSISAGRWVAWDAVGLYAT